MADARDCTVETNSVAKQVHLNENGKKNVPHSGESLDTWVVFGSRAGDKSLILQEKRPWFVQGVPLYECVLGS